MLCLQLSVAAEQVVTGDGVGITTLTLSRHEHVLVLGCSDGKLLCFDVRAFVAVAAPVFLRLVCTCCEGLLFAAMCR